MKKYLLALLALIAVAIFVYVAWPKEVHTTAMRTVTVGGVSIDVEIADTPALREQGLSGRSDLPDGKGMLFVFDTDGAWGIWMKDMRFAIDIIWADVDCKIVTIVENATPESYPEIFYPSVPARYVLEAPAGFVKSTGITKGIKLDL